MSLQIIKYPDRLVDNNPSLVSKWSAIHHAILFGMKRADYTANFNYFPTQQVLVLSLTLPVIDTIQNGDTFYVESNNGSGLFTVDFLSGPNIVVFKQQIYNAPLDSSGICNLNSRANYHVKTHIWKVDQNNQYELISTSVNKPSAVGLVDVDVSSFLKSQAGYIEEFKFDVLNQKDPNLGDRYNISFSENWQGFEGQFSAISSTDLRYWNNAAKQIQDLYGSNMGEYVPFHFIVDVGSIPPAKFLTDFETPTYFSGFPFALSFIYSETIMEFEVEKYEEQFDLNGISQGVLVSDLLDPNEAPAVNRLMITENYGSNIEYIEVWLQINGALTQIDFFEPGYVDDGYVGPAPFPPVVSQPPNTNPATN